MSSTSLIQHLRGQRRFYFPLSIAVLTVSVSGCRGQTSEDPPIHLNPNMDSQPRYDPQAESKFFSDRSTMRHPVDGTVSRGRLEEDDVYFRGRDGTQLVEKISIPITDALLKRGRERYEVFCVPCHDKTGSGNGIVVKKGYPQATNLLAEYTRGMPDGQIYAAIAYGVRNMPSYGSQIPVQDRWAIVAYVRALEVSQNATMEDVPAERRGTLSQEGSRP